MYKIIKSNISSDMNKPCWKLAKACPQSQKLFCFGENNLPVKSRYLSTKKGEVTCKHLLGTVYVEVWPPPARPRPWQLLKVTGW